MKRFTNHSKASSSIILSFPFPFSNKKNTLKIQEKNLHNKPERKEYSNVGGCSLRISRIAIKYLNIFALSYEKRRYPNSIRHWSNLFAITASPTLPKTMITRLKVGNARRFAAPLGGPLRSKTHFNRGHHTNTPECRHQGWSMTWRNLLDANHVVYTLCSIIAHQFAAMQAKRSYKYASDFC